ncbi:MAG: ABC transporter ATP-binding protein/permease [Ilumatobacteraceae bacterium]|jgi:ATP-binding cassette, subfamily B, bacterial PglK|nr:ABC transporter ATP-binding protein/permease [Ilumatobacteraceae bacterium]MDP4736584.1 ABC transporter ATP-binding protein/permease [Ilumatobacteraceae bacterium]MDP4980758.1 ABC transporter ATP-binding protein/permease [Ilumatobacteraceae bacterium]HBZ61607.1 ATPase [Acidimicrobium sp.]
MSDASEEKVSMIETVKIVWRLFTRSDRIAFIRIVFMVIIGMFLETVSLGIVVPIIGILTQDNYQEKYPWIVDLFGSLSREELISAVMVAMVFIYIVRSLFLFWSLWIQKGFSASVSGRLSQSLFSIYLRQPYMFHLQRNSSTLMRNAKNATSVVTCGVDPFLVLLTDGLVAIAMFSLLIYVEPIGTLAVLLVFGVSTLLFQRLTRRRIDNWGYRVDYHETKILQHLQEGFGGAKDVKILGRENEFLSQHEKHLGESIRINRIYNVILTLPRSFMEIITIVGLCLLVVSMVVRDRPLSDIVPILGLFAAAAFRVMPSINRLLMATQTLIFNRSIIASVYRDFLLDSPEVNSAQRVEPFAKQLELKDVSFKYPTAATPSLQDVSLVVKRGEAVGFVGPSGAGKSTLVDVILGLFAPTSGVVSVDGSDVHQNLRNWQNQIGYVPQAIYLTDDTLRRNVAFGLNDENIDDDLVREAIHLAQLQEFVSTLPDGLETVVGERGVRLSGGQRQRIGIARALYHKPSVLVLDEATSSLDTPTEHGVMQAVQALQGSKTVIIVAHRLSTVEYCDRLYRIEDSRITEEGTFAEVVQRSTKKE